MPDITVEQAVDQNCQALLRGDIMQVMNDFTPEALGALMASAGAITSVPSLQGYEVRGYQASGADHYFDIAFQTSEGEVSARAVWRDVGGFWKITALSIEGL